MDDINRRKQQVTAEQEHMLKKVAEVAAHRFVRAALSVIPGTDMSGPRRRDSAPMDPVTAAKYLTGTLKPVDG